MEIYETKSADLGAKLSLAEVMSLHRGEEQIVAQEKENSKCTSNALWVKSGNRGILKCLKVNNHFELIFHRKMFIYFLGDAKLPKVYD